MSTPFRSIRLFLKVEIKWLNQISLRNLHCQFSAKKKNRKFFCLKTDKCWPENQNVTLNKQSVDIKLTSIIIMNYNTKNTFFFFFYRLFKQWIRSGGVVLFQQRVRAQRQSAAVQHRRAQVHPVALAPAPARAPASRRPSRWKRRPTPPHPGRRERAKHRRQRSRWTFPVGNPRARWIRTRRLSPLLQGIFHFQHFDPMKLQYKFRSNEISITFRSHKVSIKFRSNYMLIKSRSNEIAIQI